jgi:hypothetical protein
MRKQLSFPTLLLHCSFILIGNECAEPLVPTLGIELVWVQDAVSGVQRTLLNTSLDRSSTVGKAI